MTFDQMTFDKMTLGKMTFDKMTFGKMTELHIYPAYNHPETSQTYTQIPNAIFPNHYVTISKVGGAISRTGSDMEKN